MRNPFLQEEKQIMRRDRRTDAGYQRAVGELVEREVIYCVSGIVFEIGTEKTDDWFHLFVQEDWETAAREGPLLSFSLANAARAVSVIKRIWGFLPNPAKRYISGLQPADAGDCFAGVF
jgi:hypothetical protein